MRQSSPPLDTDEIQPEHAAPVVSTVSSSFILASLDNEDSDEPNNNYGSIAPHTDTDNSNDRPPSVTNSLSNSQPPRRTRINIATAGSESDAEDNDEGDDDDDDVDMGGSHVLTDQLIPRYDRGRFASRDRLRFQDAADDNFKDRYILGCSILVVSSIVFVIIVSGITTMITNNNFPKLEIYSAWPNGGRIPMKYGCYATPYGIHSAVSFPLTWQNVPPSATNLVILFANAGALSRTVYNDPVHWLVTDIPLHVQAKKLNEGSVIAVRMLPENASRDSTLMPNGAKEHTNPYSKAGQYWPPCSVSRNESSVFVIHAYAIDAQASIDSFRDAREVMNRFVGVPVAKLTGTYGGPFDEDEEDMSDDGGVNNRSERGRERERRN